MVILVVVYIFILGLASGSFALAMVDRMRSGKDWIRGRSECDSCKHKLATVDLMPVLSWLVQRGKCRYCAARLSRYYPFTELLMGVAFVFSWLYPPYSVDGVYYLVFALWLASIVIMGALVIFDLRWFLLPNRLVYPLITASIVHRIVYFIASDENLGQAVISTGTSVIVASGLFWALHRISNGKWIGDGDYRFGIAAGLLLANPFLSWLSLFVASTAGLLYALPIYLRKNPGKKRKKRSMKIPFGPFLIFGLYVSYLFGERIIDWYSTAFLYL